jgi:hypothetical protein
VILLPVGRAGGGGGGEGDKKVFLRDPDPLFGGRVYVSDEVTAQ